MIRNKDIAESIIESFRSDLNDIRSIYNTKLDTRIIYNTRYVDLVLPLVLNENIEQLRRFDSLLYNLLLVSLDFETTEL